MKSPILTLSLALILSAAPTLASAHAHAESQGGEGLKNTHQPSTTDAQSQQAQIDHLQVESAYVKATIPGIKVSSGYMKMTNTGESPIRIVAVETSAAKHAEIHRMFMRDSKMAMRKVDSIEIEPKQTFELTPGGFHLMFMGVAQQFKANESISLTLIEEGGSRHSINMPIVKE
ncbi:copper chaperone PCu(A)C [Vibrio renipiscarius]|uniref:copper chaperone PCu(A)C n=1 Tax=Vibrio renipiscarius TaxID=1461322 RepID=UPI00354D3AAF